MLPLARFALARPRLVLLLIALASAAVAPGLGRLELRTDGAAIYPAGDPVVARTAADREAFQETDQVILLATARPGGPPLASPAGFGFLKTVEAPLQALPGVRPHGIRSLATMLDPPAVDGQTLHALLATIPPAGPGFDRLLAHVRATPPASGLFLAADGRAAAIYLQLDRGAARRPLIDRLERWVAASRAPFELRVTGPVAAEAVLGREVLADLSRLVPAMVAVVAILLALTLGTAGGVLVPLAQVLATLGWTLCLMGWLGVPVTLVTTVMPVLLMAMAMTDEIYLLERLEGYLADASSGAANATGGGERVRRAAERAFTDLATPLVLISATTAAGFFSFLGDAIAPIRHLGLFTGLGLLLGMLFTFTLAPALLAVLPERWLTRRRAGPRGAAAAPEPLAYERWIGRRPRQAAAVVALLAAAALPGLFRLRVQDAWVDNFDPRSPLVTAERTFNREFWGSYRFDVVFAGHRGLFAAPAGAGLMERFARLARAAPGVSGVLSFVPPYELAAHLRGDALPVSALPAGEVARVGAYVEIVQKWIDLRDVLTADASRARARLFLRNADYVRGQALAAHLERRLPALLAGLPGVEAHFSGDVPVALAVVGGIVRDQLRSIGWTALLIALLLVAALRRPLLAAAILLPVLAATLLLFAALGYLGVPLGIATSLFAALNLGAGVDFAVQYAYAYRRARGAGLAHGEALGETFATTGRGLRWNAVVLALGIAVLGLSGLKPNASLGLLLAAAMLVSYAATIALLPALLRRAGA